MDSEWIDDPQGRTLRAGDRVRYLDSRGVGPERVIQHASATGFTVDALPAVWRPRDYSMAHDPVLASTRWQYHAPTRAKLEEADRERVTVTSITSDTITVQPAPPPDSEPGWDHVPAEWYPPNTPYSLCAGDRTTADRGAWKTAPHTLTRPFPRDVWIRRASHPERVRWIEEQRRAAIETGARVIGTAIVSRDDAREAVRSATVAAPPDPFAAVRAEAKRMIDAGANPRVVLGALDDCVLAHLPGMFATALIGHTAHSVAGIARECERSVRAPCYHGNRAGTCGWCALSRDRSDARAVESHEPAWETADCEGE